MTERETACQPVLMTPKKSYGTVLIKGTPEYAAAIARTWAHANADANNETKED